MQNKTAAEQISNYKNLVETKDAREFLVQNTDYDHQDFDVFTVGEIARFMQDYANHDRSVKKVKYFNLGLMVGIILTLLMVTGINLLNILI